MFNETSYIDKVDNAFIFITAISFALLLLITFLMIFFVIKYHKSRNKKAKNIRQNIPLEIFWTVVPIFIVIAMFWYGYIGYAQLADPPDDAMNITVYGQMWQWSFEYDNGLRTDTLFVPKDTPVKLDLKSLDVNHSFYVPVFRFKTDVLPNKDNTVWFQADELGSFDIACAEYCGLKHSYMYSKVVVMEEDDYKSWLEKEVKKMNAPEVDTSSVGSDSLEVE